MHAFLDARCTKCGAKIGWQGDFSSMPACPKCDYRPPQSELDAAQKKHDAREIVRRSAHIFRPLPRAVAFCEACGMQKSANPLHVRSMNDSISST